MPVQDPLFSDMPVDLREMIAKPIGEWESNPLLPVGHYFGEVIDVLTGLSKVKETRWFAFICQPREFGPDIDAAARAEMGDTNLSDYEFPRRESCGTGLPAGQIWITPNAMAMNREAFTTLGFPETKPLDECIVEMRNRKVLMGIGRDSYERDGKKREYNVMVSLAQDPR